MGKMQVHDQLLLDLRNVVSLKELALLGVYLTSLTTAEFNYQ